MSTRYVVCATCSVMLLLAGRGESVGLVGGTTLQASGNYGRQIPERITASSNYDDLAGLFDEFRGFQESTNNNNGVPDYSAAAIREQYRGLKEFQERLAANLRRGAEVGEGP